MSQSENEILNAPEDQADYGLPSGVETELPPEDNSDFLQNKPFNPESISITSKVVSLDTVLRRLKNNTIILAPGFQRNTVWDGIRKSQLIESMALRIPLPMFYVSEDRKGNWEVVDGLQRLSTIRDFLLGEDEDGKGFRLSGLEFWGQLLHGKNFYELEQGNKYARIVNNIMETEFTFTIINPDTPDEVKRNVFKRINTGGMKLSDQEIRHALYQGKSTAYLKLLVESQVYKDGTSGSVQDHRMAGRELVLRFLAFHIIGRQNFNGTMDDFLASAMRIINQEIALSPPINMKEISDSFEKGISRSLILFKEHAFRKSTPGEKRSPINKSLFEVWINILSQLEEKEFSDLVAVKSEFQNKYRNLLMTESFDNSISRHGGSQSGANQRFIKIKAMINELI